MRKNTLLCGGSLPLFRGCLLVLLLASCDSPQKEVPNKPRVDSVAMGEADTIKMPETIDTVDDDNAIYYLVIADTGKSYPGLNMKMYDLSKALKWPVDTMNRHYDRTKGKIVLAEDDEDEMYRGEYFPRRSPSTTLSLEYYDTYSSSSTTTNIALVTGVFEQKASADSMRRLLRPYAKNAYVVKSKVYVGCMH